MILPTCITRITNFLVQSRAPSWSVAVPTIRRQSVRSLAFLQAEWIPMFTGCTSVSIAMTGGMRAYTRRSKQRPNDPTVILVRVRTNEITNDAQ